MNIDERLEALTQTVELLASMHRDAEKKQTEFQAQMTRFAEGVHDSVTRLTRIMEAHSITLDDHDERLDKLEGER